MEEEDLVCWGDEEDTVTKIRLCVLYEEIGQSQERGKMGWKGMHLELGFATAGTLGGFLSGLWSAGVLMFLLAVPYMVLSLLCVFGIAIEGIRGCSRGTRRL